MRRCSRGRKVFALRALTVPEIVELAGPRAGRSERGLGDAITRHEDLLEQIAIISNGDARAAYNMLEAAAAASPGRELTQQNVEDAMQRKVLLYDKSGEEHYNLISALHKSVRSSEVDAALYWLARMLEAGEDRMYLARRLVRMAIEDIGLADPRALEQSHRGKADGAFPGNSRRRPGAGAGGHLSRGGAEIGRSLISALGRVQEDVRNTSPSPFRCICEMLPRANESVGLRRGYQHAHKFEDALPDMECLPPSLAGRQYYEPTDRGAEKRIGKDWKRSVTSARRTAPSGHGSATFSNRTDPAEPRPKEAVLLATIYLPYFSIAAFINVPSILFPSGVRNPPA